MTTGAVPDRRAEHVFFSAMRAERVFFSAMAALILATVFVGFARTYYLAGLFRAPLPSPIIHVHGAVFSSWLLLLIAQTSLVAVGRVDLHRRLGIAGFILACLMFALGLLAGADGLRRGIGRDPLAFYMLSIQDMFLFPTLVYFAFRARSNPPEHKRFILLATIAIIPAAIARWPFDFVHRKPPIAYAISYVFLLLLIAYDLWSDRKIHRSTLWAGLLIIVTHAVSAPIAQTAAWHSFARQVQTLARG